jgi:AI-2 transport protein TqsA
MKEKVVVSKTVTYAAVFIIVFLCGLLLVVGRSLLIPIIIALLLWHFLNAIHLAIRRLPKIGPLLPEWLSYLFTFVLVGILVHVLYNIISNNVSDVMQASTRYQKNMNVIITNLQQMTHNKLNIQYDQFFASWSLQPVLLAIYGVFTTITSSAVLIGLYVIFLFVEQHFFSRKMHALFPQPEHRALIYNISNHIIQDTQLFLGIKTFLSVITAFLSWIIMHLLGLDFAEFWALLIFFFYFIPYIGAIVGTAFPAVLALIQFQSLLPCLLITTGLLSIHFIIGNLVETRYLGRSLNLSPLVILIGLAFWGSVWGVLGMFLSVPITMMMVIILAHFDRTRPTAILLSQDGCIQKTYEKLYP